MARWVVEEVEQRWGCLPADVEPRPIVLLEERVRVEGGFLDDESKIA